MHVLLLVLLLYACTVYIMHCIENTLKIIFFFAVFLIQCLPFSLIPFRMHFFLSRIRVSVALLMMLMVAVVGVVWLCSSHIVLGRCKRLSQFQALFLLSCLLFLYTFSLSISSHEHTKHIQFRIHFVSSSDVQKCHLSSPFTNSVHDAKHKNAHKQYVCKNKQALSVFFALFLCHTH